MPMGSRLPDPRELPSSQMVVNGVMEKQMTVETWKDMVLNEQQVAKATQEYEILKRVFRKFDYEISRAAQNNSAIAGYLKTDCGADDICAGTLFPALAQRFPEGEVIIKSHTVSYPRIILNEGDASIYIDSRVDAFVQQGERTRRFLTSAMDAEAKLEKLSSTDSLTFDLRTHPISIPLLALFKKRVLPGNSFRLKD
nr:Protein C06G1.1, isoform a [Haemonchus contortus]